MSTMETDSGAGAERVFSRYAPKSGATYYRSETQRGRNGSTLVFERAQAFQTEPESVSGGGEEPECRVVTLPL